MHIHILGIGGTFMAGMARLAVAQGHQVTGADERLYPPMSTQLEELGISVAEGYDAAALSPAPDVVVIGNALARGNPALEYVLEQGLPYLSGPAWLEQHVLPGRHVIAVAGTHGKTTVTSLVTWMLDHAGLEPGFLVGGVLENFGISARLGQNPFFVIEADEYDTAFFDKRSKFIHYHPRTLIINNLEFDHADIFPDLAAIQRQFHHLIRTLPASATILRPAPDPAIDAVLELGCWSGRQTFGTESRCDWRFDWEDGPEPHITVSAPGGATATAAMSLLGEHNAWNITAAAAAAQSAGVDVATALASLAGFANVRRRLELRGEARGVRVYDDFAHHPTAIAATIAALRSHVGNARIIALLEPRSNTMRMGVHEHTLARALVEADRAAILVPEGLTWDIRSAMAGYSHIECFAGADSLLEQVAHHARPGDHVLVMSNGAFADIHNRLLARLAGDG